MKLTRSETVGMTAHAALAMTQTLANLLIRKGLISKDEWIADLSAAAVSCKTKPGAGPDMRKAADMLAVVVIGLQGDPPRGRGN